MCLCTDSTYCLCASAAGLSLDVPTYPGTNGNLFDSLVLYISELPAILKVLTEQFHYRPGVFFEQRRNMKIPTLTRCVALFISSVVGEPCRTALLLALPQPHKP